MGGHRLDPTINALRPAGMLIVDDMTPDRFVDAPHADHIQHVRDQLFNHPGLISVEIPMVNRPHPVRQAARTEPHPQV